MKILELGKFYPPSHGGMETLLRVWAEAFAQRGATVDCVVFNPRPSTVHERINGVGVHRLATYGAVWSQPVCPRYPFAARKYTGDIWHLHFPNPLADLACLAGGGKTPLVVHYHSDIVRQASVVTLYAPLLRWILDRASRIVVASPQHIEFSPWLAPARSKCVVIPFGVPLDRFAPNARIEAEAAELRHRARGRTVLLNVGRLVEYKGQKFLLEAARELDAVVWLVGEGPLRPELEACAQQAGAADRVVFWGAVSEQTLLALLHACDIFVLPSITPNEAFGLAQLEAMSCGKPVVSCSLRSGVVFVNQDQITGLVVPPADAKALACAIRRLSEDEQLRRRLGGQARRRVETEFSESIMLAKYWDLMHDVGRAGRPV